MDIFHIEYVIIAVIILLQLIVFGHTISKMTKLSKFFPSDLGTLEIVKLRIPTRILQDSGAFKSFLQSINKKADDSVWEDEDRELVEVLALEGEMKKECPEFTKVIESTNAYLCKNKGVAADFNILQDICERYVQRLDNAIGNQINVPLYIGLGGTFVGIIAGVLGINFMDDSGSIDPQSINQLLNGVIAAMLASLLGLILTVINTAWVYKNAIAKNEESKNQYYDFIQRELLPILSIGMAGSLSSFQSVLNNFVLKFGENIGEYHDTAKLLNTNLSEQHLVLEEINKLSLTRTATTIAQTFADLKNSSDALKVFLKYQVGLNENINSAHQVVEGLNITLSKFQNFNNNLEAIGQNVNSGIELQKQFKDSLEVHFPTINDHREVWRSQVDELNSDIRGVYKELTEYFKVSNQNIQEFVTKNESFFGGLTGIRDGISLFAESAKRQDLQLAGLKTEMSQMRNDLKLSQKASYELNKDLVDAIKGLTIKLSKLEITATN